MGICKTLYYCCNSLKDVCVHGCGNAIEAAPDLHRCVCICGCVWCVSECVHVFEATEVKVKLLFRLMIIVSDRPWLSCSSRVMIGMRVWFCSKDRLKLKLSSSCFFQSTYP